jgi:hypothetical protein
MPALRVLKNGTHLCSVGSDDVWMFSASLHTDIWGTAASELTVTGGGKRRPDGSSDFLIWHIGHELKNGDLVEFVFEDGDASFPKAELFIDEPTPEEKRIDFFAPVPEAELAQLEARPRLNPTCRWRFAALDDPPVSASLDETRQSMSLHILWDEMRPERMRVNLTKDSLREITGRSRGEGLYLRYVNAGARVEVRVETS